MTEPRTVWGVPSHGCREESHRRSLAKLKGADSLSFPPRLKPLPKTVHFSPIPPPFLCLSSGSSQSWRPQGSGAAAGRAKAPQMEDDRRIPHRLLFRSNYSLMKSFPEALTFKITASEHLSLAYSADRRQSAEELPEHKTKPWMREKLIFCIS